MVERAFRGRLGGERSFHFDLDQLNAVAAVPLWLFSLRVQLWDMATVIDIRMSEAKGADAGPETEMAVVELRI